MSFPLAPQQINQPFVRSCLQVHGTWAPKVTVEGDKIVISEAARTVSIPYTAHAKPADVGAMPNILFLACCWLLAALLWHQHRACSRRFQKSSPSQQAFKLTTSTQTCYTLCSKSSCIC